MPWLVPQCLRQFQATTSHCKQEISSSPHLRGRDASFPRVAAAASEEPPPEFPKANTDPLWSARGVECDTASALWLLWQANPLRVNCITRLTNGFCRENSFNLAAVTGRA